MILTYILVSTTTYKISSIFCSWAFWDCSKISYLNVTWFWMMGEHEPLAPIIIYDIGALTQDIGLCCWQSCVNHDYFHPLHNEAISLWSKTTPKYDAKLDWLGECIYVRYWWKHHGWEEFHTHVHVYKPMLPFCYGLGYVFYFLVMNNGAIWRCVNSKMCPTLWDAFMVKSVFKCSLFTYMLEHFQ